MNVRNRLERLEGSKQKHSLFDGWEYHLVDTQEKYNHPERFKPVFDFEDESGDKWFKLIRI